MEGVGKIKMQNMQLETKSLKYPDRTSGFTNDLCSSCLLQIPTASTYLKVCSPIVPCYPLYEKNVKHILIHQDNILTKIYFVNIVGYM